MCSTRFRCTYIDSLLFIKDTIYLKSSGYWNTMSSTIWLTCYNMEKLILVSTTVLSIYYTLYGIIYVTVSTGYSLVLNWNTVFQIQHNVHQKSLTKFTNSVRNSQSIGLVPPMQHRYQWYGAAHFKLASGFYGFNGIKLGIKWHLNGI
mgnify:CR=1 FL=1